MTKRSLFAGVVVCLLAGAVPALAQGIHPPKVLQIFREEVKPGKVPAHEKLEAGWPRAFASAKWPTHYLAMTSLSGPLEAWFMTGYESMAAWEADTWNTAKNPALSAELDRLSAADGELLTSGRSIVASFREDMSYLTNNTAPLGTMRYFYLTIVRVRPGHESEYVEMNKIVREAHQKANVPERWVVYQVNIGMPRGTFIVFQPLKSLADVDAFPQTHGKEFQDAIGEDGNKKLRELTNSAILSSETNIFAFNPKMSYPTKEIVAADPEFWTPKPKAPAKAAAAGKPEEKPAKKP